MLESFLDGFLCVLVGGAGGLGGARCAVAGVLHGGWVMTGVFPRAPVIWCCVCWWIVVFACGFRGVELP